MSLIIRSVTKISKKKRKSGNKGKSRKGCKDPFEDNPTKFVVEDEEKRSDFPTLNSVYKTELFGTPSPFRSGSGYDCMKFLKIKTKLQSIVFMSEYTNKSFEELRWEDYQCNRKGSRIFEEKNYLRCLSKDAEPVKWNEPKFPAPPKDANTEKADKTAAPAPKIILQRPGSENKNPYHPKERSILTSVNKFGPIKETNCTKSQEAERQKNPTSDTKQSSKEEMVKDNLQRYFSSGYTNASVPYEFYSQNNNYFLPCANISLAYKNAQTKRNLAAKTQSEYIQDLLKSNPFGYNSIFDKLDPLVEKGRLYEKVIGGCATSRGQKMLFKPVVDKYTADSKFSKDYFLSMFRPYSKGDRTCPLRYLEGNESRSKAKKHWLGFNLVAPGFKV